MRISRAIFYKVGMYPIIDHYYEPLSNPRHLSRPLSDDRNLPAVDFNLEGQLELLKKFNFNAELSAIPFDQKAPLTFYYHNGSYESGDAEFLYNMVRHHKPKRIIEIGCGLSTLMIQQAAIKNKEENESNAIDHICVEPYEMAWLEQLPVNVKRSKVEDLPLDFFKSLNKGDILFIDSSHVVRPQGDVLFEFLEILPTLNAGVVVHVHDIFTPKDYPREWVVDEGKIWTEQYLLEAFLSYNSNFKIVGALNYLHHQHREALAAKCPILANEQDREPGAFWIEKIK
ncbi:MAG: class I SAM-dependent methyltransferase [Cyclobacteriaceae bacterium]|nr:class I SAM-dependent methyltransferase [Cyclobacteriaceae bacterium]